MHHELGPSAPVIISDSETSDDDIDDELEAVYYENSKLFSQIENEYLDSIREPVNTTVDNQGIDALGGPVASLENDSNGLSATNIAGARTNSIFINESTAGDANDDIFVDLFTSSSSNEDEKSNYVPENLFTLNEPGIDDFGTSTASQDFMTPLAVTQSGQIDYNSLERYWYSDEDLPPLESVYTLDKLKNTPSLAYMYDFFYSKISIQ